MSPNELNTTLTPHSIIPGDACFAYFKQGIPDESESPRSLSTLIATCLAGLGRRRNAPGQMRNLSTFRGTVMHFGNGFDHARFTKSSPRHQ
jgi:hypothetical protein